jgi:hypothetical protein
VDPSYLSRIEGGTRSVSEELEPRITEYYGLDPDLLELAAGRVPADVMDIIRRHPGILTELRESYGP